MRIRQQRTRQINISKKMMLICLCMILMVSIVGCGGKKKENLTITNVSYDPTREFYEKYNKDFIKYYKNKYGKNAIVKGMDLQDRATTMERNEQIGGHRAGRE